MLEAWDKLKTKPDVLMLDGQGIAHPRRFGIACHVGLLLDLPTIGCAKSILVGKHGEVGLEAEAGLLWLIEANRWALRCERRTRSIRFTFHQDI